MDVIELEYAKDVFDKVECAIDQSTIKMLRDGSQNDTIGVAEKIGESFLQNNVIATTLILKGTRNGLLNSITVYNELKEEEQVHAQHGVVLFSNCCIDLLHSDRVIPIKEYMETLERLNPSGFVIDAASRWFRSDGTIVTPTVEDLKKIPFKENLEK